MAQLPCFKESWAIYPPFFLDIDGAAQDSAPSTLRSEYFLLSRGHKFKLDDGWRESEKDVVQAALRMVVVKESRWIVGEFYMSYGGESCEITQRRFYTQTLSQTRLHTETFTHRGFYTQTLLHADAFTHKRFYTQKLLHTGAFTHRLLYTQTLLHTEAFTHRRFYTQRLLHTDTFTHRSFYTQTLLHTNAFAHRPFYTQTLLHTEAFTHRRFYTQMLLHTHTLSYTEAFTHRSFWRVSLYDILWPWTQTVLFLTSSTWWHRALLQTFADISLVKYCHMCHLQHHGTDLFWARYVGFSIP